MRITFQIRALGLSKFLFKIVLFSLLNSISSKSGAQSTHYPVLLNSAGGYGKLGDLMFDFNVGEMVLTQTFTHAPGLLLSQGFLQPHFWIASPLNRVTVVNNIISPNGDGKNDVLKIEGLNLYTKHTMKIFDRAGRIVFKTSEYKNDWGGTINGMLLNEDTYYYVIDLEDSKQIIQGYVSIILDF